jgi:hypothetical protein
VLDGGHVGSDDKCQYNGQDWGRRIPGTAQQPNRLPGRNRNKDGNQRPKPRLPESHDD